MTVAEKAQRLVEENRVILESATRARVAGDSGVHHVTAEVDIPHCDCRAWRPWRACSHVLAAMVVWAEEARSEP